jgi:hypothetical protein
MVRREEFASGEVAEDVGERPSADDLAVAANGELVRDVGEAADWVGGCGWAFLRGEDGSGLAFHGFGRGVFRGCSVAEDDGDEDAEGTKEEAEDEAVPALAGACERAADEGAKNPDEEDGDGVHGGAMVGD